MIADTRKATQHWEHRSDPLPYLMVPMSDGRVIRYNAEVPHPGFVKALQNIKNMKVGYPAKDIEKENDVNSEERACEWCHNSFPENEMIETEFGYLCGDCFRERMDAEDRENNG